MLASELKLAILDMETDGLYDEVTKMHCIYIQYFIGNKLVGARVATTEIELQQILSQLLAEGYILVGHNLKIFDLPVIKKITNGRINYPGRAWDSLAISYCLYPDQEKHGLEYYGNKYNVPKPIIKDWNNLDVTDYIERCKTDVVINSIMFFNMFNLALAIYDNDVNAVCRYFDYLSFKFDCAAEQVENPLHLDIPYLERTEIELKDKYAKAKAEVEGVMPKNIKGYSNYPAKPLKQDGSLSSAGQKWLDKLEEKGLPLTHIEPIPIYEEPKITSPIQVKKWLFSLGWIPTVYKYSKTKTGVNKVPQIQDEQKNLCQHLTLLSETTDEIKYLEGFYMIKHRKEIVTGMLKKVNRQTGTLPAEVLKFTNTLRFTHVKPIVNLPGVGKPYGKEIRGAIIAPPGYTSVGSDMKSLEDTTKQHYMYYFDPKYVTEMRVPGFSPHLDIGVQGDMITKEEADFYIWFEAIKDGNEEIEKLYLPKVSPRFLEMSPEEKGVEIKRIGGIRKDAKQVNFSAVYGVGPPKLSLTTGWSLTKATEMLKVYWEVNKSVKQIAAACTYKKIGKSLWLYNPVSRFWYSLRDPKDIFSTLNQGTGVYVFDTWVRHARRLGVKVSLQYHDEIYFIILDELAGERVDTMLLEAVRLTNEELKLNVMIEISIDKGKNYADTH